MIRHSHSLFISIILHLFLATLLFLSYHYIFKSSPKKEQEHLLCLQLANYEYTASKQEIIKPQKHLQTHQRVTQKSRVKIHKKQAEKKVLKKVKIKKVIQKPKDNVESIKKPDNGIKNNTIKVTQKRSKTQVVEKKVQKTNEETYVDANIQKIVKLLQNNLYYPRRARKRGIQGDVSNQQKLIS